MLDMMKHKSSIWNISDTTGDDQKEAMFSSNSRQSPFNHRENRYYFKINIWCGILEDELIRKNFNSESFTNFLRHKIFKVIKDMSLEKQAFFDSRNEIKTK